MTISCPSWVLSRFPPAVVDKEAGSPKHDYTITRTRCATFVGGAGFVPPSFGHVRRTASVYDILWVMQSTGADQRSNISRSLRLERPIGG